MTAPTIPTTAAELEEMLNDSARMQAIFKEGQFGEFVSNYVKAMQVNDPDIATQVKEETQRVFNQMVRDNNLEGIKRPDLAPDSSAPKDRGAAYNPKAAGAALDTLFPDGTTDFMRTIWHNNVSDAAVGLRSKIKNDYSSNVPADGGFLIPESLRSTLLQVALEMAIVRPRAMVVPMESARVLFPTVDSTSNASSVHGGMVAYWTEEAGTLQRTSAKFGRVALDAKKLTGYSVVPNELFTDALAAFTAFINQKWPEALAWFEDLGFINGTGVGEPLGWLRAKAAVSVAKESGQVADTILWENIAEMFSRMLPASLGRAVWIANLDTFRELATMALSVGTGGSAIWLNNGAVGPPMTILGRPVIFTEKVPTKGDAGDLNFVDLSYYLIGDRQQMQMATSEHIEFDTDQTAVRIIERVDGRPWINSAITPQTGANTLSPFVKIAARA